MKKILTAGVMALGALAFPVSVFAQDSGYSFSYDSNFSTLSDAEATQAAGLFGAALLLPFIFVCIFLIVGIVVSILIFKDAKKKNIENPALWLVLSLVGTFLGFAIIIWIIYLVIRNKRPNLVEVSEAPRATGPVTP